MAQMKLPTPEFAQKDAGHSVVRVTLRNDIKQRRVWVDSAASKIIGEAKSKGLSEDAHRAINFVAEHGTINVSQLQRLTGRSWPSAKNLLKKLAIAQILRHKHSPDLERDPGAYYILWSPEEDTP
jgi:ATP-dependent DNA helicase RecG